MAGINLSPCFVALILVLLVGCKIEGKDITVRSSSDCRSYDLDDYSEININYKGDELYGECEIEIEADENYPRICIEAEKLFFDACAAEIEVHAGFVTSSSDKDYSCSSSSVSDSKYCSYLNSLTVVINELGASSTDIKLRVYPGRSEFDTIDLGDIAETAVIGVYVIVGIVIGAIVLLVIIVIIVVCCCCNKRRAASGTVYRNQQPAPQPPQGTYPQVQYQAAPQTAGYQPPPQGYQPPPQGYQPPPQGYQPAPQGYSGPPPEQGFQMAGYQQKPSAPPPEKDAFAPPAYPGN